MNNFFFSLSLSLSPFFPSPISLPWLFHHAHLPLMPPSTQPPPLACPATGLHLSSIQSPFSPLHTPLHTHSTPLFLSPQPRSLSLTPRLPLSLSLPLFLHPPPSIGTPPSPLGSSISSSPPLPPSLLPLPGWFPQLWWVRGRWPENWPLGERWAILVLLGSWLIIGVSDQGKINQGESWGMFGAALFTHRPRWMKLHLSVFSCITPKLVVYSFFLPPSLALSLSFLPLCPHSCVSGPLKGFDGEIPVIFVFSLFSPQPAAPLPAYALRRNQFKMLSYGLGNFHVTARSWHPVRVFCVYDKTFWLTRTLGTEN